jgi:hypothetical protein
MLVVTLPWRAEAMVVVAAAASAPPSVDPPLELPEELPELEPLELPELEPLELPELDPLAPPSAGGDDELLLQANRDVDATDAAPSAIKARVVGFMGART